MAFVLDSEPVSAPMQRQLADGFIGSIRKHVAFPKFEDFQQGIKDEIHSLGNAMLGAERKCHPGNRVIYLKTHKTGSSTLTNIFHRYALKAQLRVVLPKSDLFLGWPSKDRVEDSYVHIPNGDTYDMFCSAHARYSPLIRDIVPDAQHVTVLREPASHFVSSWNYWGTAQHIKSKSGMDVTMEQLLDDPKTWWPRSFRSDKDLLQNSQAFDLGIEHEASKSEVQDAIEEMDGWTLVMITEYMDESLVLWKRLMCWDLEDVAYFSLKVNGGKKKKVIESSIREKIYKMNWIDATLYKHFNESLWKQIAKEHNFTSEVNQLRQLKKDIMSRCQSTADWDEDRHRKALLGELGELSSQERQCHLLQLDSGGFVKYLKKAAGVPKLECHRQGRPLKAYVYQPIPGNNDDKIITTLHRYAAKNGLRPALPRDTAAFTYGFPSAAALPQSVGNIPTKLFKMSNPGTGRQRSGFDVLVSAPFREGAEVNMVVKDAPRVGMLRDPITRFVTLWNDPNFASRRRKWPVKDLTLSSFLANHKKLLPKIPEADKLELFNGQAYALGWEPEGGLSGDQLASRLYGKFSSINGVMLIADYMDHSLVLLRRFMCWELDMISQPVQKFAKFTLSETDKDAIINLNRVDIELYTAMNRSFWDRIGYEIDFEGEISQLHDARERVVESCQKETRSSEQSMVTGMINEATGPPSAIGNVFQENAKFNCFTYLVGPKGFALFLMRVWKIKSISDLNVSGGESDSCSAGPTQQFIFLKTHKTGSSTLTNIFHRYVLKHNLRAVLPIDNMYLGWPSAERVTKSYTPIPGVNTYDVLCSGHATWSSKYMRELVPYGRQVTVLRNPISHFFSSWNHWHPHEHIVAMGGPLITMDQFLDDPDKYWEYAKWSDKALLKNSFSYDFGIGNQPAQSDIDFIINALQNTFDLVLITEWMDESLLLLKEIFCWSLDDVLYYSLKVAHQGVKPQMEPAKKHSPTPQQQEKIKNLVYADLQIYEALNRTFHEKLAKKGPKFYKELALFKARKSEIFDRCNKFEQWEEDKHRKLLLEGPKVAQDERECHTMMLDSKGFVKVMKRNLGIQTRECTTVSVFPMKHLALVVPRGVDAAIFTSFAYRGAAVHRLSVLVPKIAEDDDTVPALDWDKPEELDEVTESSNRRKGAQVMGETFVKYDRVVLDKIIPGDYFIALICDPVVHFAIQWKNIMITLPESETAPTMKQFLAAPTKFTTGNFESLLPNPQLYDLFGLRGDISMNAIIRRLDQSFRMILDVGRVVDSLILLRRMICWDRHDNIDYRIPGYDEAVEALVSSLDDDLKNKIRKYSPLDTSIHKYVGGNMNARIEKELAWDEELREMAQWNGEAASICSPFKGTPQIDMLNVLLRENGKIEAYPLNRLNCYLQLLDKPNMHQYQRRRKK